ncbi:MAG: hypothetical protein ABJD13_17545 [Paracoccaceae bacterium]
MSNFLTEAAHDTVATKVGKITSRRVPISTNAAAVIKVSYAALFMNPSSWIHVTPLSLAGHTSLKEGFGC